MVLENLKNKFSFAIVFGNKYHINLPVVLGRLNCRIDRELGEIPRQTVE